jgi:SAM-dependent methyltransferase
MNDAPFVRHAVWILAGRPAQPPELAEDRKGLTEEGRRALLLRLVSSPEFQRMRDAWQAGRSAYLDPAAVEAGLRAAGPDAAFVELAYLCVLGRAPDAGGQQHYAAALAAGGTRADLVRSLALSDEFAARRDRLLSDAGGVPRDCQLCELANPAKWDNDDWLAILRSLALSDDKMAMHRKPYELTQLVFGCRRLGALRADSQIVSVGAGHERVLYWLANEAAHVYATDMYEGVWQDVQGREGDPDVLVRPEDFAPFPYRRERLTFLRMDGRQLAFRSGTFDIAYSLSSIEHFGGLEGAAATIHEMGRVLKPGGILALATEYVLHGPPHPETFQPAEFRALIATPGLKLVEPVDEAVYRRYEYRAVDLYKNPYQTPHMVVRFHDTVFTTAMVFLRKLRT